MSSAIFPGLLVGYKLPSLEPLWDPIDIGNWKTEAISLSPKGKWLAVGTAQFGIRVWHVAPGRELEQPNRPKSRPMANNRWCCDVK